MREKSPWQPRLATAAASPAEQLVLALSEDILSGILRHGDRLPAHRDLADRLRIGLGTVTKAYGILEKRGLVFSTKGRGMFVALVHSRNGDIIDLSKNNPPAVLTSRSLTSALSTISHHPDMKMFNNYAPVAGHDEHRRIMAQWFASLGVAARYQQLMLTSGAQHALFIALSTVCEPGGKLYVEAHTYSGLIRLSQFLNITLVGIPMDDEGMCAAHLAQQLQQDSGKQSTVYLTPLLQSPTTRITSLRRRQALIDVCRQHDAWIIEDDVYRLQRDKLLPQMVNLAPEITLYINSLSKIMNPALRVGGLLLPERLYPRAEQMLNATAMMVSPVCCAIMERWLTDGTAETVINAIAQETARRYAMAREILGEYLYDSGLPSFHLWLPLPRQTALRVYEVAKSQGIYLTSPLSTEVAQWDDRSGIRMCIGAPDMAQLKFALTAVRKILAVEYGV